MSAFYKKYLKYKTKYIELKNQIGGNREICNYLKQIYDAPDWYAMENLIDSAPTAPVNIQVILDSYSSDPAYVNAMGNAAAMRTYINAKIAALCPLT